MFKRKLIALDYHQPDNFDVNDEKEFRCMIVWLEDQKIRHYKIEERGPLREADNPEWMKYCEIYLKDINCPLNIKDRISIMEWLLGYAVRLEYGDNIDKLKNVSSENSELNKRPSQMIVSSSNPLDNLDFQSAEFKAGVASLATLLNVPRHPDHLITLKAIAKLIREKLSNEVVAQTNLQKDSKKKNDKRQYPLDQIELGFDTSDYILNQAAKILRLCYIKNLRDLQTKINEAIVSVQNITANPKTDQSLGKVGR